MLYVTAYGASKWWGREISDHRLTVLHRIAMEAVQFVNLNVDEHNVLVHFDLRSQRGNTRTTWGYMCEAKYWVPGITTSRRYARAYVTDGHRRRSARVYNGQECLQADWYNPIKDLGAVVYINCGQTSTNSQHIETLATVRCLHAGFRARAARLYSRLPSLVHEFQHVAEVLRDGITFSDSGTYWNRPHEVRARAVEDRFDGAQKNDAYANRLASLCALFTGEYTQDEVV